MTEQNRLESIAGIIRKYYDQTQVDEYTDVGDAWEVLAQIYYLATGDELD